MREILFRGKSADGEWVCGNLFDWGGDGDQVAIVPFCEFARYANWEKWLKDYTIPVFPETVGQYTGLKDKNGRWIYEGDIIKCDDTIEYLIGVVAFGDGYYDDGVYPFRGWFIDKFYRKREGENPFCFEEGGDNSLLGRSFAFDIEVVGNKWDNPELLKDCAE